MFQQGWKSKRMEEYNKSYGAINRASLLRHAQSQSNESAEDVGVFIWWRSYGCNLVYGGKW